MSASLNCQTQDWGRTEYNDAFSRQLALVEDRLQGRVADTLVLTEHEPVYTIGARKGADAHLVWTEKMLAAQGIQVVKTNRGGDITYHGPGQIVGYPILSLREKKDLHGYLRDLEQVLINSLGYLGLAAHRREGMTGIWLEKRKIAAIGVAVRQWITYHGFALNVSSNLNHYQGIIPCGIGATEGSVTSISQELGTQANMDEVKALIDQEFWKLF